MTLQLWSYRLSRVQGCRDLGVSSPGGYRAGVISIGIVRILCLQTKGVSATGGKWEAQEGPP